MKPAAPVFFGIPTRDGQVDYRILDIFTNLHQKTEFQYGIIICSLLAWGFNQLYSAALNRRKEGVTHFLLLHADIIPLGNWYGTLLTEMQRFNLDAIAANVPFRSDSGICSTGYDTSNDRSTDPHRYMIQELEGQTLTSRERPGLLINTGCLLMDISKPWAEEFCFRIHDGIHKKDNGDFEATCLSEDWYMSRWMTDRQIPFGATSKVKCLHVGAKAWPNWTANKETKDRPATMAPPDGVTKDLSVETL